MEIKSQTVEYKGTTKFKYTITSDNEVRIKIPDRFIGTVFEQGWISMCNEMTQVLLTVPRTATLRGRTGQKVSKIAPKVHLRIGQKHVGNYDIFNKTYTEVKKEVE